MSTTNGKYIPCRNSTIQEYQCQVCAWAPFQSEKKVCFDACLARELFWLWDQGIRTTGCCCGQHGESPEAAPYIAVAFEDTPKMKALGYVVQHNELRPDDKDSFWPKTFEK
jgi:hypothetical protein